MGIQDRDYHKEWSRERERSGPFDRAKHTYNPKDFRGRAGIPSAPSGWGAALVRTVVICLAVYGALALVRDFRTGLKPWQSLDPEKVQRLLPYLSGK